MTQPILFGTTQPIRFTVITDDPARAAQEMFGGVDDVPPFVRIVAEPRDILDLPEGSLAMAWLFSRRSAAEVAFEVLRHRGALRFPDTAFLDRLDGWLERRDARRRARDGVTAVPAPDAPTAQPGQASAAPASAPRRRNAGWK